MLATRVRIGTAGRLVIPGGTPEGARTQQTAIRHAQEMVRQHVPPERSLVDELIQERRGQAGIPRNQREAR